MVTFHAVNFLDTRNERETIDVTGKLAGDREAAKITDQDKLKCPICSREFNARNEYDDHWVTCHQDDGLSMASGSMGSLNAGSPQSCQRPLDKQERKGQ
jgi:hypothetical protein